MSISSYDTIPYSSKPDRGRHVDRLASIAHLVGLTPADIRRARILEIGCGTGKNLIATAELMRDAQCVGLEPSSQTWDVASELAKPYGNVVILRQTIEEYASDRRFDYIVCHGVLSWVSKETQQAIFKKLPQLLADDGIAFISYNTFPGWHLRQSVRDLLLSFDDKTKSPAERVLKGKEVLRSVHASVLFDYERPYSVLLHQEIERILKEPDAYLLHEFLADENHAWYYRDFCAELERVGLQSIGDARFSRMTLNRLFHGDIPSDSFRQILRLGSEVNSVEHVMDHIWCNVFRESIVCHSGQSIAAEISVERLRTMSFTGYLYKTEVENEFKDVRGHSIVVTNAMLQHALGILTERYPSYIPYPELLLQAQRRAQTSGRNTERDEEVLAGALLEWIQRDCVEFSLYPPNVSDRILAHPQTTPFIRKQAEESELVVNLCHNTVELGALERELVKLLDGTRSKEELVAHAKGLLRAGAGGIKEDGVEVTDPQRQNELIDDLVYETLETIRRAGILLP